MISPDDIQITKHDLTLFSTILVVYNLINHKLRNKVLFDEKWMNFVLATLLGVVLHGLLTNRISLLINNSLNINKDNIRKTIYDLVRFSTIFASQKVIESLLVGEDIIFDSNWMMISGLTITGYSVFNILESLVPRIGTQQPFLNDIVKLSIGTLLASYGVDNTIGINQLLHLFSSLSGCSVFHLFTKHIFL
jgi:hypothetical protein